MYKLALGFIIVVVLVVAGGLVADHHKNNDSQTPLTLALDWTPNTNHTGIYVAQAKGWYAAAGINLKLLPYSASASSDSLVGAHKADVGVSSTEAIVSDAAGPSPVVSIAAIIAKNTSVIAVRKDSGITSPKQLDGKIYGGFGAPYESAVMGAVIKHAGGSGSFKNVTINTDAVTALASKQIDFAWVFSGWEVIQAQREGLALTTFPITDYGIPDYSTPDLITSPQTLKTKSAVLKKFMTATAKGYEYARTHPAESAQILIKTAPAGTFPDKQLVIDSQRYLSPRYQVAGQPWGVQARASWTNYPQFMLDKQTVLDSTGKPTHSLNFAALYTNKLLQ